MPDIAEQRDDKSRRAQLVRIYEANTGIDFPTEEDLKFRSALSRALGLDFDLRGVRNVTFDGPAPVMVTKPATATVRKG